MRAERFQSGLALVMVLWLVAAMSLLVASVVYLARMDVQLQQFNQTSAKARAFADKAMRLSMRQFVLDISENGASAQVAQQYNFEGREFSGEVGIYPASGLVHLGSLTPELLLAVLRYGVGLDENKIEILNEVLGAGFVPSIVEGGGLPDKFRVLEDLLLIPGVSVDTYEALRDYFYIGQEGVAGINPAAAPRELLLVLAGGDVEAVEDYMALRNEARNSKGVSVAPHHVGFLTDLVSTANNSVYRVDVTMEAPYQQSFKRRYWLVLTPSRQGMPWTMQSKEPILVLAPVKTKPR